jgi:branched-chain amino acid transport system ATP-binding protein
MELKENGLPLLDVQNLWASIGLTPVLQDVSFTVWPQQIVAMVGPNGAGKTTILKAVAGIIRPVRGRILYDGVRTETLDVADIVRLGMVYVPEGMSVFPEMSVLENLEVGGYLHRHRIEERLRLVFCLFPELEEKKRQRAGALSGGEKRMVTLGRGLMAGARLLLLDDPFLGLSPKVVRRFCSAFQKLRQSGLTLLIAGQHVRRILRVADVAFLIEDGSVTLTGPGPEILRHHHVIQILFGKSDETSRSAP